MDAVVSIIDRDAVARRALLRMVADMELTAGAFASELDFWEQHEPARPGCLLLDLGGENTAAFELIRRLHQDPLHPPVIGLAETPTVLLAVQAMQAGTLNFLDKAAGVPALTQAIAQALVVDGQRRHEHAALVKVGQRFRDLQFGERQVLDLLLEGLSNQGIAARLNVSVRTVEVRRARLMRKMHARSLAELVSLVVRSEMARPREAVRSGLLGRT